MIEDKTINIRIRDILKVFGMVAILYMLYLLWDIVLLLFVALIFAALIDPFAASLARRKIPRGVAVVLVYIIFFGVVGTAVGVLAPVVAYDVPQLVAASNDALSALTKQEWASQLFGGGVNTFTQTEQTIFTGGNANGALAGLFSTVSGFFGGIVSLLIVLVMTFYLVSQDDPLGKILRSLVPENHIPYVSGIFRQIRDKLGSWMRAQLVLSITIGTLVTIGLSIIGVKYAAVLGLLAALLEFIPILGPIFASIPALFFAFSSGGFVLFVIVFIMYIVIQQFENHILVPKIMQRAVGLNPVVSIIAILVGARFGGVVGVILAIPVATVTSVILKNLFDKQKDRISDV
ncbi:MAG: hypothetical protein CO029_03065 [Candidatus Magasanikbacteria bacterium CG_4_9_14_0_2_um_filter_41_10]|uniref:AI-2E family transporter n=1 Tax=Candidatus Magasanikbacteria bacterium CG_4_10_14_0_2_um_filter_41_31 TaxID=1974639 RepID=A0A2M7V269_9BACT|nr:MAG: hypothetical protein AUJ37_01085 [Candidatus Magasanikbacteria bacterium CG1_02_41_34]PIZ92508.1 MAG: hypothetical protein COX83_04170 [Candidatus Magasanikbacteria bacterium CG_4_10_14_0_2_um_filter_41_31]PJC53389.1 MAG: hypothetical protein CO029_03065 [Candidatus Magasanikbacteria bacterium CG_4_9_14_0_2_um_filter_41_10]